MVSVHDIYIQHQRPKLIILAGMDLSDDERGGGGGGDGGNEDDDSQGLSAEANKAREDAFIALLQGLKSKIPKTNPPELLKVVAANLMERTLGASTISTTIAKYGFDYWNSTTMNLRIQEAFTDFCVSNLGAKAITPEDLLSDLLDPGKINNHYAIRHALRDNAVLGIWSQTLKDIAKKKNQTLISDSIDSISASMFFTSVLFDGELSSQLTPEQRCLIGNALSFACWKEALEFDIMLENPSYITEILAQPSIAYESVKFTEMTDFFTSYNRGNSSIQQGIFSDLAYVKEVKHILQMTPWCGIKDVSLSLNTIEWDKVRNKDIETLVKQVQGTKLGIVSDRLFSRRKREKESQYMLAKIVACLHTLSDDQREALRLTSFYSKAKQLMYYTQIVDKGATVEQFGQMASKFKLNTQMKKAIVDNIGGGDMQLKEMASTMLADIISGTGSKLLHKVQRADIILPFIMTVLAIKTGLYKNIESSVVAGFSAALRSILFF